MKTEDMYDGVVGVMVSPRRYQELVRSQVDDEHGALEAEALRRRVEDLAVREQYTLDLVKSQKERLDKIRQVLDDAGAPIILIDAERVKWLAARLKDADNIPEEP